MDEVKFLLFRDLELFKSQLHPNYLPVLEPHVHGTDNRHSRSVICQLSEGLIAELAEKSTC